MGKNPRDKQVHVGTKMKQIRDALELSQNGILERLQLPPKYTRKLISNYENDHREPPLIVLLAYAREAGVCLDVIANDEVELPRKLPATPVHRPATLTRIKSPQKKRKTTRATRAG
ncbi:MAG TPA: helix-turn-helix transcriptional regulator [Pyrinomonadaceae bacterium]